MKIMDKKIQNGANCVGCPEFNGVFCEYYSTLSKDKAKKQCKKLCQKLAKMFNDLFPTPHDADGDSWNNDIEDFN
jgi:hypothetical protein